MDKQMRQRGFVLLKPSWLNSQDLNQEFKDTVRNFPDFKPNSQVWGVRQDGILTNPGSFHNPLSRRLRQCATSEIAPIIADLLHTHPNFRMQCLFEPMAFSPTARQSQDHARWWYKRSPFEADEVVICGYANLGSTTQTFTCAPGTHICQLPRTTKPIEVFRRMHKSSEKKFPHATDCGDRLDCDGRTVKIRVPPGTLVVYHTTLLVKIETARAAGECTQHFKWAFGNHDENRQAAQNLTQPSAWPSYYPRDFVKTKRKNALMRLQSFSRGFPPQWLTDKPYGNLIASDTMAKMGPRIPPVIKQSLRTLGESYPNYGPDELKLYTLSRGPWRLGDGDWCPFYTLRVSNARQEDIRETVFNDELSTNTREELEEPPEEAIEEPEEEPQEPEERFGVVAKPAPPRRTSMVRRKPRRS
jgi:hypothetical protein